MGRLTNQEAFDKSATHLLTQMTKAIDSEIDQGWGSAQCAYRAPGGAMCAIGALIPNRDYRTHMEGQSAEELIEYVPRLKNLDPNFLEELQNIHDCHRPSRWGGKLRALAKNYDLDPSAAKKA